MHDHEELGLEESWKAASAIIQKAKDDGGEPIAVAVVNSAGQLICYASMDGTGQVPSHMAITKAYTSAHWRRDTRKVAERMSELDASVADEFGIGYTSMIGGVAVVKPGEGAVCGAIGVAGRIPLDSDEALAHLGLDVIKNVLWPSV